MNFNRDIKRRPLDRHTDQNKPFGVYYHEGYRGRRVTNARMRGIVDRQMRAATWCVYCAMPEIFRGVTLEAMARFCKGTREPVNDRGGMVIAGRQLPRLHHPTRLHEDAALANAIARNKAHIIRAYEWLSANGKVLSTSRHGNRHDYDTIEEKSQ